MYSGETQNYKLPQYEEQDQFDPIADWNPAFETIDGELYKAEQLKLLFEQKLTNAELATADSKNAAEKAESSAKRAENIASGAAQTEKELKDEFNRLNSKVEGLEAAVYSLTKRVNELEAG